MATRGAFGLTHNGQTKMVYNHRDGYPEGLGQDFIKWLKQRTPDELLKARDNMKIVSPCSEDSEYGRDKFAEGILDHPMKLENADEMSGEEYRYNYNIDHGTMQMDGCDYAGLKVLEQEMTNMPHLHNDAPDPEPTDEPETFIFKDDEDTYLIVTGSIREFHDAYIKTTKKVENGEIENNEFYEDLKKTTGGRIKIQVPTISYHDDIDRPDDDN